MIKICIVLALLVTVSNSAAVCQVNQKLDPSTECECKATTGSSAVISTTNAGNGYWCMNVGSAYTIKTNAISAACTTATKVVTGSECRIGANANGVKYCLNNQVKATGEATACTAFCAISTVTTGCKTCGSAMSTCDKCNAGYYYVSGATCIAQMCKKGTWVTGADTNTVFAACDSGKEYDSKKADTACTSGCTSALCCKDKASTGTTGTTTSSSMSLGIQTVLIVAVMNFIFM